MKSTPRREGKPDMTSEPEIERPMNPLIPAARGGIQGGAAYVLLEAIAAFEIYAFTPRQWGVSMLILTPVLALAQNVVEKHWGKAFLKNSPESAS